MMDTPHTFDATLENFQEKVMQASMETPVLVDVWADWSEPCKQLTPILDRLVEAYGGRFLLAKVNADQQQELTGQLGVRGLPTVILVKNGQAADGFTSALPESEIRKVLDKHVEAPQEPPHDKAKRLWEEGDLEAALAVLTEMNQQDPENAAVLIDLAQLKAELGDAETAQQIFDSLAPEDKMQPHARQLAARLKFLEQAGVLPPVADLEKRLEQNPDDSEALHQLALHRIHDDDNAAAMELLFHLIKTDSAYGDGIGKTTLVELFEKLGNANPDVRTYRRKLYTLMH
jgi:putative thioredoxin